MLKYLILVGLALIANVSCFRNTFEQEVTYDKWKSDVAPNLEDKGLCVFFRDQSLLSCAGYSQSPVECDATFNFEGLDEELFDRFVIGLESDEKIDSGIFHLYPRLTGYNDILDFRITLLGKHSTIGLSGGVSNIQHGLSVNQISCFNNLVELFSSFKQDSVVIQSYLIEKPKINQLCDLIIV